MENNYQDANFGKIVRTWQVNNLIGKIMLIIETMGLNENQLEASKSIIKQSIWSEFNEGVYISDKISELNQKENEKEGYYNITK